MSEAFYSLDGPLDAMPDERQLRAANFAGFHEFVRSRGSDPRGILERHGMDARAIRDPDYFVACKSLVDVLEDCSAEFDDPLFGLRFAETQEPDVFGCVAALCRSAPSMRAAINGVIDFLPAIHCPSMSLQLVEGSETAELRWSVAPEMGDNSQANLQGVLLDLKLLRQIGGPNFRPAYVNLALNPRSRDLAEIEERLACRFNATAHENAIGFSARFLDQPVPSANRLLYRLLGGYLSRVKSATLTSLADRVEAYVRGALPTGACSIDRCAKRLGISVRTLQAQLADLGMRFSDILERQRVELAKSALEQPHLTLDEVAAALGYSEQSSFGRAFKRWTGETPQGYRERRSASQTPLN